MPSANAEELAGAIAHAIHTPLAALMGTLQMLHEDVDDPRVERALGLSRRIGATVTRMLELVRCSIPDATPVALADLLDAIDVELRETARKSDVTLEFRGAQEPPGRALLGDRELLVTAVVSVAENALAVLASGGVLRIETSTLTNLGMDVLRVRVIDDGPGIPGDLVQRIFEPFEKGSGKGSGLGLAIARGIVEAHAGRITVESTGPTGTTITLDLPLKKL